MPPDLIAAGKVFDIMWLGVRCYGGSLTHLHQNPKRILAGSPRTKSSLLLILPTSWSSKIVPRDGFTFLAMGFSGARAAGFPGPSCVRKKQQVDVAKTLAGAVRSQHGYVPLSRFINPVDRSGLLAFLPQVHFLL